MIQIWLELLLNQKNNQEDKDRFFSFLKIGRNWNHISCRNLIVKWYVWSCIGITQYYCWQETRAENAKNSKNESEIKPQLYIRLVSQKHRNMKVKRFRIEVIWNSLNPAVFFQISGCYKQVFLSFDLLRFSVNESSPKGMHYLCNSISNHLTIQCSLVYILYKLFIYTDQF